MLEMKNITKIYNPGTVQETCLFRDFSLTINKGSFVSVVGSNGSGKTSSSTCSAGQFRWMRGKSSWTGRTSPA